MKTDVSDLNRRVHQFFALLLNFVSATLTTSLSLRLTLIALSLDLDLQCAGLLGIEIHGRHKPCAQRHGAVVQVHDVLQYIKFLNIDSRMPHRLEPVRRAAEVDLLPQVRQKLQPLASALREQLQLITIPGVRSSG